MVRHVNQPDRRTVPPPPAESFLLLSVGSLRCALPLSCVVETMRPLPVHPLAGTPPFVAGTSLIRGQPTPVVQLADLLGMAGTRPARLVLIRAGVHHVALAVDSVIGIREIDAEAVAGVPPLLATAVTEAVAALAASDGELLVVLRAAHIVPEDVWPLLARPGPR